MNLVKLITDQISSDTLAKLSTQLGVDSETIESAITAAVPSMLAGLGGLASHDDGIRKLSSTLGGLDDTMFGNYDRLLNGDTGALAQKGSGLLQGLFGDGLTSNLATAVSRFTGVDASIVKSLLAYLTPLVLGRVASQWRNQGGTPGALKTLFSEQKRNIEDALPSGFELADVPGLPRMGDVQRTAAAAATNAPAASKSLFATVLPLALVLGGAFLLWSYFQNRPQPQEASIRPMLDETDEVVAMKPVLPETAGIADETQLKHDLAVLLASLTTTLTGIKDDATAAAALPKLGEIDRQIDALQRTIDALPEASRTALHSFMKDRIDAANQRFARVSALPGISEQIRTRLTDLGLKIDKLDTVAQSP